MSDEPIKQRVIYSGYMVKLDPAELRLREVEKERDAARGSHDFLRKVARLLEDRCLGAERVRDDLADRLAEVEKERDDLACANELLTHAVKTLEVRD